MSFKGEVRQALSLWIPGNSDNLGEILLNFHICRNALDRFLDGLISFDTYLEILNSCNVDVDDYCQIADDNLSIL
jgi:hypothetical protein